MFQAHLQLIYILKCTEIGTRNQKMKAIDLDLGNRRSLKFLNFLQLIRNNLEQWLLNLC